MCVTLHLLLISAAVALMKVTGRKRRRRPHGPFSSVLTVKRERGHKVETHETAVRQQTASLSWSVLELCSYFPAGNISKISAFFYLCYLLLLLFVVKCQDLCGLICAETFLNTQTRAAFHGYSCCPLLTCAPSSSRLLPLLLRMFVVM